MQSWLREHFHITATVLYDRPSQLFKSSTNNDTTATDNKDEETKEGIQRPSLQQRHDLLSRLEFTDDKLFPFLKDTNDDSTDIASSSSSSSTKLLVSATSWTADEDFSVLLDALQELERCLSHTTTTITTAETTVKAKSSVTITAAVRLLVVVTGKGPMKAAFEARVKELADKVTIQHTLHALFQLTYIFPQYHHHYWQGLLNRHIAVRTAWLTANDYALLLRCADLGNYLYDITITPISDH